MKVKSSHCSIQRSAQNNITSRRKSYNRDTAGVFSKCDKTEATTGVPYFYLHKKWEELLKTSASYIGGEREKRERAC